MANDLETYELRLEAFILKVKEYQNPEKCCRYFWSAAEL